MVVGVLAVNLSQRHMVVVVLAVLLFVVAGLVVSATQRARTQGERGRPSTGGVPASVAVLPGLAAAGVAAVAIVANNRQERTRQDHERQLARDRQEHERQLKIEELEDQRQSRLRDERLKAYRRMQDITRTVDPTVPYEFNDLSEAYSDIALLTSSPTVLSLAWSLFGEANKARRAARDAHVAGIKDVANDPPFRTSYDASQVLRDKFVDAAREELGLSPLPSPAQAVLSSMVVNVAPPEDQRRDPS